MTRREGRNRKTSSMAHVSDIFIGGSSVGSRIAQVRSTLATRIAQYRTYRTTLAELRNLSVRELDDLGLNQETLRATAYEAAYK